MWFQSRLIGVLGSIVFFKVAVDTRFWHDKTAIKISSNEKNNSTCEVLVWSKRKTLMFGSSLSELISKAETVLGCWCSECWLFGF